MLPFDKIWIFHFSATFSKKLTIFDLMLPFSRNDEFYSCATFSWKWPHSPNMLPFAKIRQTLISCYLSSETDWFLTYITYPYKPSNSQDMLPFAKFDGEAHFQGRLFIPKSRKSSRNMKIIPMLLFNENSLIHMTCYLLPKIFNFGKPATFSSNSTKLNFLLPFTRNDEFCSCATFSWK